RHELLVLQSLELGELLYQLFGAVPAKLYCNLRVVTLAFSRCDDAFAILRVPHTHSLAQPRAAAWRRNVHLRSRWIPFLAGLITAGSSTFAEEGRCIVQRARSAQTRTVRSKALRGVV